MKTLSYTLLAGLLCSFSLSAQEGTAVGSEKKFKNPEVDIKIVGEEAPNFTLKNTKGEDVSLSDYKDKKIVVVNFWSYKCPTGKRSLDKIAKLATFCEKEGIPFLGVCPYGETVEEIKKFKEENKDKVTYTLLMDQQCEVAELYDAQVVPTFFIIEKGKVVYGESINGFMKALKEVLAKEAVSNPKTQARG